MKDAINFAEKLSTFTDQWSPRIIARMNDLEVMVVKVQGDFVWHKHEETDDLFMVLRGVLDIQLRDRTVTVHPGELFIVPKGVEHCPRAQEECHLLIMEKTGTPNTGDETTAVTKVIA